VQNLSGKEKMRLSRVESKNNIALFPARGGSKRIPRKNVRDFRGQPMIAWPIAAARESGLFEEIMVSTDDDEVAAIARSNGAEVPFRRPESLSNDQAGTEEVMLHLLNWLEANGRLPEYFCCIYPTSPLITSGIIKNVFESMKREGADSAFTAVAYPHPIWRALRRSDDGRAVYQWPEYIDARSQDLPEMIHDAGQCYWVRSAVYRRDPQLINGRSLPVVFSRWQMQDIDTEEDWLMAEKLFSVQ